MILVNNKIILSEEKCSEAILYKRLLWPFERAFVDEENYIPTAR